MTDLVVRTTAGAVGGRQADGVASFLGIPYAAPPVGDLRFTAPAPVEPWVGVRPCNEHGPTAPQPQAMFATTRIPGDDYLHVDVHTPSPGPGATLPVYVWIHGGGFVNGSNAEPATHGARLASRGIVVVAVNYRLGAEGFAVLDGAPNNRAVLDWLAALRWVQDNIAAFGGDPTQVTIGGQSAGSAAVLILAAIPAGRGLFHRVHAMSGVCWNLPDLGQAVEGSERLAAALGVPRTIDGFQGVDTDALLAAQVASAPFGGFDPAATPVTTAVNMATVRAWLSATVDGDLIPVRPYEALVGGARPDLDLLTGSTLEESNALFTMTGAGLERPDVADAIVRCGLPADRADRWLDGRPWVSMADALGSFVTNLVFRAPVLRIAEGRNAGPGRTFVYETTWRPATMFGAVHAIDVAYVFGNTDAPALEMMAAGPPPQTLADDMVGALAGFVIRGDPGWPAWTADQHVSMHFDLPSVAVSGADALVLDVLAGLP